jgi:sortase (surface protein transpeptidase)
VDGDGKFGIFHRLRELKVGSQVAIERVDGSTVSFVAYRVERFNKDTFPTQDVYGNTEGSELRLITCGGVFNPKVRSYEDNIVVFLRLN